MNSRELNRVVYFSKEDMSSGYNLKNAEKLLNDLDVLAVFEINNLLELYNIKLYFDNELFLLTWDESTKNNFKSKINEAQIRIKDFWLSINDENIDVYIVSLEFNYKKSFWELFNYFQIYKKISKSIFSKILQNHPFQINYILSHKNTVSHFDKEIRTFLIRYNKTAELLLTNFEEGKRFKETNYIFPKSLSLADKENIISEYIDDEEANLNYIRLVEHSKDSNDLKLSAKVRLKAKKKSEELNGKIFEEGHSWKVGVQITLDKDQIEPVVFSNTDHVLEVSYSEIFLDKQINNISLFFLFKNLFDYTDNHGIITLVNKEKEMNVFEKHSMKSKNEYLAGIVFQRKSQLSYLQLLVFNHYLNQKNNSIEILVQSFIKEVLNEYFKLNNLQLRFPTNNSTFLEKIRIIAPELEFLLKQYQVYSSEGEIDFELIEINSSPLRFSEIKSIVNKKYGYIDSNKTYFLKYQFFSDQSILHHVEPFNEKYSNLYDLLTNEDVKFDNFKDFQKDAIRQLLSENYLTIDANSNVKIQTGILISIIGDLHKNEVISYWHYPKLKRNVIDEMVSENLIRFEDTLFSKQEINFFNYYLNKKEYTNGLDIRNKYLHGTNRSSEKEHEYEYYILLKLIILTLLKITDDLMLKKNIQ